MDITKLKHSPARIKQALTILEDNSVIANETIFVHIPYRYVEKDLANIGEMVKTIGAIGFIVDGCYSMFLAQARFFMQPSEIRDVTIDDVKYYELEFSKGDTVFVNLTTPIETKTNYFYFIEFTTYGKIPWFMNYDSLYKLFDHSKYITEKRIGSTPHVYRILSGIQTRDPDNPEEPYRYSKALDEGRGPVVVGLNNHTVLLKGVFNRIGGGFLSDNILGSILEDNQSISDNDIVLRGLPYDRENNKD